MKRWIVLLLLNTLLFSCSLFPDHSITFSLTNALGNPIQSISIHPIHDPQLVVTSSQLANDQTTTLTLSMRKATQCDGCYVIEVEQSETTTTVEYGYYTNGMPLEELVYITIDEQFLSAGE